MAAQYDYDSYGNTSLSGVEQPFQFAGQYTDAESGLQYLRARYYDPATEQFLGRDPLTRLTREPYIYAIDSPVDGRDPSGLISGAVCATGTIQFVVAVYFRSCAALAVNTRTHQVTWGFTQTVPNFGSEGIPEALGSPSFSLSGTAQLSTAESVSALSGRFAYGGGSIGPVTGDYFQTPVGTCPGVKGVDVGFNIGFPPVEVHGGISETFVEQTSGWWRLITFA